MALPDWLGHDVQARSTPNGLGHDVQGRSDTYNCAADLGKRKQFLVYGATSGIIEDGIFLCNMPTQKWVKASVKGTPPEPWYDHGSCRHKAVLYCYCGVTGVGETSRLQDGLFALHFGSGDVGTWSKVKANRRGFGPLSSFSLCPFHDALVLYGGYDGIRNRGLSFVIRPTAISLL